MIKIMNRRMHFKLPRSDSASLKKYINEEYVQDGYANVHINIPSEMEIYDPLSYGTQLQLNQEIIDYIDQRTDIIPTRIPLRIIFHGRPFLSQEQDAIRKCLCQHYTVCLMDKQWDRRRNRRQIIALTLCGLSILAVYILHALTGEESMRTEILSIIASFSLWEAVDLFVMERRSIDEEILNMAQLLSMNIEFKE